MLRNLVDFIDDDYDEDDDCDCCCDDDFDFDDDELYEVTCLLAKMLY